MLHAIIAVALFMHGAGHAVGFWMPVPVWLMFSWLLPGIGFLVGSWAYWQRADWWPAVILASAMLSLLLLLPSGAFTSGPFASALAFDLAILIGLMVPWSRRLELGL